MLRKLFTAMTLASLPFAAMAAPVYGQECWTEQVQVQGGNSGIGGALVGGVAGGILGNQIGDGSGQVAATVIGAVAGAVVGDRVFNSGPRYETVQRCRPTPVEYRPVRPAPRVIYVERPARPRVVVIEHHDRHGPRHHGRHEGHHGDRHHGHGHHGGHGDHHGRHR